MTQHIIIANFANHSLALLQWAINHRLPNTLVIVVDTGFAALSWHRRVEQGIAYANTQGIHVKKLLAKISFSELVKQQRQFPSVKFQWCAGFLKGLIINEYLDEIDPGCEASILLAKRRCDSRVNQGLTEFNDSSEHYNDRVLWYPLIDCNDHELERLIAQSGFDMLSHRSLECEPCIHSRQPNLKRMDTTAVKRLANLEVSVGQTMFEHDIHTMRQKALSCEDNSHSTSMESFDMGCGSVWGCGE